MSKNYANVVKEERARTFGSAYDFVYTIFEELEFHNKDKKYFFNNASEIVEALRNASWSTFLPLEKAFTSKMLQQLVNPEEIKDKTGLEAVTWFVETFPDEIYSLTLSNTQSRRSRAGKEFEAIIELILIGAEIPLDSQGNIGKKVFVDKGLGKLVDIVSPGAIEYNINKRNTVLISAKTTLRERWQEVPEEMGRTGAREMFLATLDQTITSEVLQALDEGNIQIITTKSNKEQNYSNKVNVLSFEELLSILEENKLRWTNFQYALEDIENVQILLKQQKEKHTKHSFVKNYYDKALENIK